MSPVRSFSSSRGMAWPPSAEALSALVSVSMRVSSAESACPLAVLLAKPSILADSARTSSATFVSVSFEATCETMPRSAPIAVSSCSIAAESAFAATTSILCDSARNGLVNADQAFGRGQAAQGLANFGQAVFEAGKHAGVDAGLAMRSASALTSISSDSTARRGSASVNWRPMSAKSERTASIAFSRLLEGRRDSIWAVMSRSWACNPLKSMLGGGGA